MYEIDPLRIFWLLIPVVSIAWVAHRLSLTDFKTHLLPIARMVLQLLLIGFLLKWIFQHSEPWFSIAIALVMILAASWISLRHLDGRPWKLLLLTAFSIGFGGVIYLVICLILVLRCNPWYEPKTFIPIAGMIFANAMTGISIMSERIVSERNHLNSFNSCKKRAFAAALIPITNACLAIGLVSLPGMMTGQILSGVSPMVAVRYQAMIMLALYGSVMTAVTIFLATITESALKK